MKILPPWPGGVRLAILILVGLAVAGGAAAFWLARGEGEAPRTITTPTIMPATIQVVKAQVTYKPFEATANAAFIPISEDSSISMEPNTRLVTNATGIARLRVTLGGLATPAPSSCQVNPATTVDTLPGGLASNLLLTLNTGVVYCNHPELERFNRPTIFLPDVGELRFERAEVKAVLHPGREARIAVAQGVVEFELVERMAEGEQSLIIEAGEQLVLDLGSETRQMGPSQFIADDLDVFKGLEETPMPLPTVVGATVSATPSPTSSLNPTEAAAAVTTPTLLPADTPLPISAPTPTATAEPENGEALTREFPTPTLTPTPIRAPTPTATRTPTPTLAPAPIATSIPTGTPMLPLRISASSELAFPGSSIDFDASGGMGADAFSIAINKSGSNIDPDTGLYTAGSTTRVTDTVRVTDAEGNTDETTITVRPTFEIFLAWFAALGGGASSAGGEFSLVGAIGQPDAGHELTGGEFTLLEDIRGAR